MNGHDFTLEQNTEARMMLAAGHPPHRHHKTGMGLSNGACSNHVGWSESSRTHSPGTAAQVKGSETGRIVCGHRVHDHVLGAGLMAVIPRPIRFGRNSLMDLYPMRETVPRIKGTACLTVGFLDSPVRDARRHGACGRLTQNGRLDVTASIPALTPEEEQPPLDGCEGDWKVKWDTGQGKLSVRGRKAMLEGESL